MIKGNMDFSKHTCLLCMQPFSMIKCESCLQKVVSHLLLPTRFGFIFHRAVSKHTKVATAV